jgi:heat shock protein HslJ
MKSKFFLSLLFLISIYSLKGNSISTKDSLTGTWQLSYLKSNFTVIDSLFPSNLPSVHIIQHLQFISGNAGCNSFSGTFSLTRDSIKFNKPLAMTMMACPFSGETVFIKILNEINHYKIKSGELFLYKNKQVVMKFRRTIDEDKD